MCDGVGGSLGSTATFFLFSGPRVNDPAADRERGYLLPRSFTLSSLVENEEHIVFLHVLEQTPGRQPCLIHPLATLQLAD